MSLTSDELNYFVLRYLLESGFVHSAYTFSHESFMMKANQHSPDVPPGALISFVQKGLQYAEIEAHITEDGTEIECDNEFTLQHPHVCSSSSIRRKIFDPAEPLDTEYGIQDIEKNERYEQNSQSGMIQVCIWHPTLPILATGSADGTVRIWNFTNDNIHSIRKIPYTTILSMGEEELRRQIQVLLDTCIVLDPDKEYQQNRNVSKFSNSTDDHDTVGVDSISEDISSSTATGAAGITKRRRTTSTTINGTNTSKNIKKVINKNNKNRTDSSDKDTTINEEECSTQGQETYNQQKLQRNRIITSQNWNSMGTKLAFSTFEGNVYIYSMDLQTIEFKYFGSLNNPINDGGGGGSKYMISPHIGPISVVKFSKPGKNNTEYQQTCGTDGQVKVWDTKNSIHLLRTIDSVCVPKKLLKSSDEVISQQAVLNAKNRFGKQQKQQKQISSDDNDSNNNNNKFYEILTQGAIQDGDWRDDHIFAFAGRSLQGTISWKSLSTTLQLSTPHGITSPININIPTPISTTIDQTNEIQDDGQNSSDEDQDAKASKNKLSNTTIDTNTTNEGEDFSIFICSIDSKEPLQRLSYAHNGDINTLKWCPFGITLATGSDDGLIKVWRIPKDLNTQQDTIIDKNISSAPTTTTATTTTTTTNMKNTNSNIHILQNTNISIQCKVHQEVDSRMNINNEQDNQIRMQFGNVLNTCINTSKGIINEYIGLPNMHDTQQLYTQVGHERGITVLEFNDIGPILQSMISPIPQIGVVPQIKYPQREVIENISENQYRPMVLQASGSQDTTIRVWDQLSGQCKVNQSRHVHPILSIRWARSILTTNQQDGEITRGLHRNYDRTMNVTATSSTINDNTTITTNNSNNEKVKMDKDTQQVVNNDTNIKQYQQKVKIENSRNDSKGEVCENINDDSMRIVHDTAETTGIIVEDGTNRNDELILQSIYIPSQQIASSAYNRVIAWDTRDGTIVRTFRSDTTVNDISWFEDAQFAIASSDGTLFVVDSSN